MTQCETCKANLPSLKTRLHRVNASLYNVGLVYYQTLPFAAIDAILYANGFSATTEVSDEAGDERSAHFCVGEGKWLHMSWYQMPSGWFEVTAYVN